MKLGLVYPKLIALAILLAGSLTTARAINIRNREGKIIEVANISGTVSRVDPARHTFTLTWKNKSMLKMERYWPSYQEDYQVTDATIYKNGSWANVQKGTRINIAGRGYVATLVQILTHPPHRLNPEVFSQ
jgi:hypothetical protein